MSSLLRVHVFALSLFAIGALEQRDRAAYAEIKAHDLSVHQVATESTGRLMRRHGNDREATVNVELDAEAKLTKSAPLNDGDIDASDIHPPASASDDIKASDIHPPVEEKEEISEVVWGWYSFYLVNGTNQCKEDGVNTWEGKSLFETWSGTTSKEMGSLTITDGSTLQNGRATTTPKGLRIYKAACPNATAVKVGATMEMPTGTRSIDLIFALTQRCTGDCAPFMITLLDGTDHTIKQRWCWNREGDAPEIYCDVNHFIPFKEWHRATLDITNFTDFVSPMKMALEVYTSGDFTRQPSLPGQDGVGGRASVLIDTLVFGPANLPKADSTFTDNSRLCRQSLQKVCNMEHWCMDKYRCWDGMCAEGSGRCNGQRNCADDSDEVGCEQDDGFRAEFFLNHVQQLDKPDFHVNDVENLTKPDVRVLHADLVYTEDTFWSQVHAKDMFAARWSGNFTIANTGKYNFAFPNTGTARLDLEMLGVNTHLSHHNVKHDTWIQVHEGKYQLSLAFVHLKGEPHLNLTYTGKDTRGQEKLIPKMNVSATMTGARCDTMQCPGRESLIEKAGHTDYLCETVPCTQERDSHTCCTREYKVVAAGGYRTCALDMMGRPVCWPSWPGFNEEWKNHPGPFVDISTRGDHICAVRDEDPSGARGIGMVECWGDNFNATTSLDYSAGGLFTNISVGGQHTCAVRDNGKPACTGSSSHGQNSPPAETMFSRISAGDSFTCGIAGEKGDSPGSTTSGVPLFPGSIACWGANELGESTPPSSKHPFTHLSAGESHACAITNGSAMCWGSNSDGQADAPVGYDFTQVAPGGRHTCALKKNGTLECWGRDKDGQATPTNHDAPYLSVSSGKDHSCAIRASDNEIVCWGSNYEEVKGKQEWRGQSEPPPAGLWP